MPVVSPQYDVHSEVIEILKDCRTTAITQEFSVNGFTVWRVEYVVDPDRDFSSLDDQERSIKSRCKMRSVSCRQNGFSGQTEIEIEWI